MQGHFNAIALTADGSDQVFAGVRIEMRLNIAGSRLTEHALDQLRCQFGTYGIGTVDL